MDENEDGAQVMTGSSKLDTEHNFSIEGDWNYTIAPK
jgi:hypothetical protein